MKIYQRNLGLLVLVTLLIGVGCTTSRQKQSVNPCTTEVAPPSESEPEEIIQLVTDPTGDYLLDHPLLTELYDIVFEDNSAIPPALDIVQVEVSTENDLHTIEIRTWEGNILQEMNNENQRVNFNVLIDSDGNGISDFILSTTNNTERGVIVTSQFELIAEMPELIIEDNTVTMQVPKDIVGEKFLWTAVSGYSPNAEAYYPSELEGVFVAPDVDIVVTDSTMTAIIGFYSGPGSCQIVDKLAIAGCPSSPSEKMFYRKQCGSRIYEFWCRGCCFGSKVSGGGTTGWVGKCPFLCGLNSVNIWSQAKNAPLNKIYHTIHDANCNDPYNQLKHKDSDGDNKIDLMAHTYYYDTDVLESCNIERNETTNAQVSIRCCPKRKPYKYHLNVPGNINGSAPNYNCPTSAP